MIVLAIVGVLSVMVIVNQNSFNKAFIFTNTVYDIGLVVRSAESYGLGSKALNSSALNTSYGIHFDASSDTSFLLFADTSGGVACPQYALNCSAGNGRYDAGQDPIIETYKLGNGITIQDFCAGSSTGSAKCKVLNEDISGPQVKLVSMDIVFTRPYSQVQVAAKDNLGLWNSLTPACLKLLSPTGSTQNLSVSVSGMMQVKAVSCP
jgi:hypothetical protein